MGRPSSERIASTTPPLAVPSSLVSTMPVTPTASVNLACLDDAVLARRSVEDEENLCQLAQGARRLADLAQLVHEVHLGVQSAGCVRQHETGAAGQAACCQRSPTTGSAPSDPPPCAVWWRRRTRVALQRQPGTCHRLRARHHARTVTRTGRACRWSLSCRRRCHDEQPHGWPVAGTGARDPTSPSKIHACRPSGPPRAGRLVAGTSPERTFAFRSPRIRVVVMIPTSARISASFEVIEGRVVNPLTPADAFEVPERSPRLALAGL